MTRFRLGQDVMRALALGARSCMIGCAHAYGLGGEAGVAKALDILAKEMLPTHGIVRRQHGCIRQEPIINNNQHVTLTRSLH